MLILKDNSSDHTQPHQITANYPFLFVLRERLLSQSFQKLKEYSIKFPLFNH